MTRYFRRLAGLFNINGRDLAGFLLSLLLAFSIWFIHNLSQNYSRVVRVPVIAESVIEGHAGRSMGSSVVQARCRTTGFTLIRLDRMSSRNTVTVQFQPSDMHLKEGDIFYITAPELEKYVSDIFGNESRLESFLTDTLYFRFPTENHKKVPVQPSVTISYKSQYTSRGPVVTSPDSVTVYGEPYLLEGVDKVYTRPFMLLDLDAPASGDVKLEKIRGVRFSADEVGYSLDVSRYVEIRAEFPVAVKNVPSDRMLIVYPAVAEVNFRCEYPVTVRPQDKVTVTIDYRDFSKSIEGKCIPGLEGVPAGVISWTLDPEVFECVESSR